jgi:hypothetical protein
MLRIRKYINERGRASVVGIALIVVLAVVLSMAIPALAGSVGQTSLGWKNQEGKQEWNDGNYGQFPEGNYWQCQIILTNDSGAN